MATRLLTGATVNNQRITDLASPTAGTDAANKDYVDAAARNVDWKASVRVASTANIDLTTGTLLTIDGIALAAGDRVLVKDQTTASQNGIYVAASGAWTRAVDADSNAEVTAGMATTAAEGTVNGDKVFILITNDPIVLGTTALAFTQLGGGAAAKAGGAGLTETATSYDVGAGLGITVTADAVAIDTAVVTRKVAANNANATSTAVTHNFGTRDVQVYVFDTANFQQVFPDVFNTDLNTVTVTFVTAPAAGAFRIVVQG